MISHLSQMILLTKLLLLRNAPLVAPITLKDIFKKVYAATKLRDMRKIGMNTVVPVGCTI